MIVRILTDRPDQYAFLEELYRGRAELLYTTGSELMTAENKVESDILIADPELAEGKQFTGTLMKRRTARGKPFVISEPDRVRGLVRELKAAGLKTDGSLCAVDGENEKTESVLPGMDHPQSSHPSFRCYIGILDFNEGAGAGFLTMLMAEELASESFREGSLVTVFAPDSHYFFNALSLGKKYGQNGFQNVSVLLQDESIWEPGGRVSVNVSEGISWAVGSGGSQDDKEWSSEARTQLAEQIEGNYFLCFYGSPLSDRDREEMKNMLDVLVVVGDPLPSSLLSGKKTLDTYRQLGIPVVYVINHVTDVVKKDLILDYLDANEVFFLPAVDPSIVCEAEYMGENPYRIDRIRKQTMAPVCGIIERIKKLGNFD